MLAFVACNPKVDDPVVADDSGGVADGDALVDDAAPVDAHPDVPTTTDASADADDARDAAVDAAPACTPPVFGGVTKIDGVDEKSAHLHWDPAKDAKVPVTSLDYLVFVAAEGTSFDFTKPPTTTIKNATDVVVSGLASDTTYFFVVRASNGACSDSNVLVRTARSTKSCHFDAVQAVLTRNCAVTGCHIPPTPPQGMALASGFTYSNTVNVTAVEDPTLKRVDPGNSANSYLYRKITGFPAPGTSPMPLPGSTSLPTADEKELIRCWIDLGALP